jgi:hypothetical protein
LKASRNNSSRLENEDVEALRLVVAELLGVAGDDRAEARSSRGAHREGEKRGEKERGGDRWEEEEGR